MKRRAERTMPIGPDHGRILMGRTVDLDRRTNRVERKLVANKTLRADLPVLPNDGQIIYYQTTTMAGLGVVWNLRYNASSSSTYKWESVGSGDWFSSVPTQEAPSGTGAWLNLATDGPSVTVPLAGDYLATVCATGATTAATIMTLSFGVAAGDTSPTSWHNASSPAQSSFFTPQGGFTYELTSVAAATAIKCRYQTTNTNCVWQSRTITVRPVRVG